MTYASWQLFYCRPSRTLLSLVASVPLITWKRPLTDLICLVLDCLSPPPRRSTNNFWYAVDMLSWTTFDALLSPSKSVLTRFTYQTFSTLSFCSHSPNMLWCALKSLDALISGSNESDHPWHSRFAFRPPLGPLISLSHHLWRFSNTSRSINHS